MKGRPFRECVFFSGPAIVSVIVSVFGVTLVALVNTDSTGVGKVGEPFKLLLQFKSTSHGSLPIVQAAASIQSNFRSSAPRRWLCAWLPHYLALNSA